MSKRCSLACCFSVGLLAFASISLSAAAQPTGTNEWAWVNGSNQPAGALVGTYGTLGTFATGNAPSGRIAASGWTDKNGNLWLFGGFGTSVSASFADNLDDLWEYDPASNEWAWMGGSYPYMGQPGVYGTLGTPAAGNWPGSRQAAATWTDSSGNFWMFGGLGYDTQGNEGWLNDVWRISPTTNEWTWMGGSNTLSCPVYCSVSGTWGVLGTAAAGNIPAGRLGAATWIDSKGNFWLFGGFVGLEPSAGEPVDFNDLWEFDPSTNEWTWMSGINTFPCGTSGFCGQSGLYGTLGTAGAANVPGGRDSAVGWTDKDGNLWLFAGEGHDINGAFGSLNDLWMFNRSTNQWTWMGGGTTAFSAVAFGSPQIPSVGNIPLGGPEATVWTDMSGNPWFFGGDDSSGGVGNGGSDCNEGDNDFWAFNISAGEWAWMGGGQGTRATDYYLPVYGTMGMPAAGNVPGGRCGAVSWTDKNGNFWLFGGAGFVGGPSGTEARLNDLWEFVAPSAPVPVPSFGLYASPASVTLVQGTSGTATINAVVADGFDSTITLAATDPFYEISVSLNRSSISGAGTSQLTINVPPGAELGPYPYPITVTGTSGDVSETTQIALDVTAYSPVASPTFSVPGGVYSSAQSVAISDATPGATIYYSTAGYATANSPVYNGAITVSSTETINAIAIAGDNVSAVASATYTIELPPNFSIAAAPTSLTVTAGQSGTATITVTPANGFDSAVSFSCSGLPAGAKCSFSPATVTPPGTTSTTLTIATSATTAALHRRSGPLPPEALLTATLCCFGLKKRRRLQLLVLLGATAIGLSILTACGSGSSGGGSGGGGGSQPVTSTVTVTATSGSLQQTTTFTLTVN
jgi:N-acetylneuraminic acid mutarotase